MFSSCKKDYAVERSIVIDAPADVVWQQVNYFENWQHWSPWYAKDSTMEWMLSGTDGEIESGYSWTSENSIFLRKQLYEIMKSGVTMEGGMPSGLYFTWDMKNMRTDLAAAIPVASGTKAPEGTTIITIPESKAVMVDYYGAYEGLGEVHGLIEGYLIANQLEYVGPAIEEYITDPEAESDPRKWNTKVTIL